MSNVHGIETLGKNQENAPAARPSDINEYYVGGAGNDRGGGGSGLAVIGGPSGSNDLMNSAIERARSAGRTSASPPPNARVVTMYRNGFTIDDGPFRPIEQEANREFLRSVAIGQIPLELATSAIGGEVAISLKDNRQEDYSEPLSASFIAFGGQGQTMGSGNSAPDGFIAGAHLGMDFPKVDAERPVTALQIRLANGKKVRMQINLHSTIREICKFINSEGAGTHTYTLTTGFPPKPILSLDATIRESGLSGAVINQKLV